MCSKRKGLTGQREARSPSGLPEGERSPSGTRSAVLFDALQRLDDVAQLRFRGAAALLTALLAATLLPCCHCSSLSRVLVDERLFFDV